MGGEQEVLQVPRRVNAKSFARFRALPERVDGHPSLIEREDGVAVRATAAI